MQPPSSSGYYINEHSCVVLPGQATALPSVSPLTPQALQLDEEKLEKLREALARIHETEEGNDELYRLPMALDYYSAGRVVEADALFRSILVHEGSQIDDGTKDALAGRFRASFRAFAKDGEGRGLFFGNEYGDSGAIYNLQRGMNALAIGDTTHGRMYLGYSEECSLDFGAPHLIIGVLDLSEHDFAAARSEFLISAGMTEAIPDMPSPSQWQLDAIDLLLHYF